MKQLKKLPYFKTEDAERKFWASHDSTDYVDYSKAKLAVFPNLKPSAKKISVRIPEHLLASLKLLANKNDVPYQSLMKIYLAERVKKELSRNLRLLKQTRS